MVVTGTVGATERLIIDQSETLFGPGAEVESTTPEIEVVANLGDAADRLVVTGTPGDDTRETIKPGQLPAGVTEAQLCGLAGANYDDLPEGTYAPSVELPDKAPLFP